MIRKEFTVRQMAAIKRVAQNVNPLVIRKNKIIATIAELNAELDDIKMEIDGHESGVKNLTGGYVSEDLIVKKVEDTGKLDKNGKPVKVTKYEPREEVLKFDENSSIWVMEMPETYAEQVANSKAADEILKEVDNFDTIEAFDKPENNINFAE